MVRLVVLMQVLLCLTCGSKKLSVGSAVDGGGDGGLVGDGFGEEGDESCIVCAGLDEATCVTTSGCAFVGGPCVDDAGIRYDGGGCRVFGVDPEPECVTGPWQCTLMPECGLSPSGECCQFPDSCIADGWSLIDCSDSQCGLYPLP